VIRRSRSRWIPSDTRICDQQHSGAFELHGTWEFAEDHMEPFRHHVYVCTQEKPEGVPSCSNSNSVKVLQALEREVLAQGLDDDVQITTCGCMGLCDDRPVIIVYPEGVWYHKVQEHDAAEIVASHLANGRVVSRLVWTDLPAMKSQAIDHRNKYRESLKNRAQSQPCTAKV
jgi:(2Fe-2S) ferredoxin